MSTIANLDVNVRGNASGLDKAIKGALGSLNRFKTGVTEFLSLGNVAGPAQALVASTMDAVSAGASKIQKALSATAANVKKAAQSFHLLKAGVQAVTGAVHALESTLVGIAATGLAAFAGLIVGSREGASEIEELARAAKDIGVTVDKLAGLQHAADLARVDFDVLKESLVSMQVKLRSAGYAAGNVAIALSQLGIAMKDVQEGSPDQQFLRIAEALSKVGDQTEKARLATVLLGEQGSRLLPLFEQGADGIKSAMEEAKSLGLTVSEQEVKQVQEGENAMNRMKKSFEGLFRTAAVAFAPLMTQVANSVTKAITYISSFKDSIVKAFKIIEFVFANFSDYVDLYFDKALLKVVEWANDIENFFMKVIPTAVMEGVGLIKPAFNALVDWVAYSMVRVYNTVAHVFTEVIPEFFKNFWNLVKGAIFGDKAAMNEFADKMSKKMQRPEGDIERILREDSDKSGAILRKAADDAAKKIGQSFKREMGAIEGVLAQDVARKQAALDAKFRAHMAELDRENREANNPSGGNKPGLNPNLVEQIQRHDNAIAERGSQEAFKLIAGANQDKALKAAADRLAEMKKQTKLLEKLVDGSKKPGLKGARL